MLRTSYPLEDHELHMPNGEVLGIVSGDLDIEYYIQRPEPDVGIFQSWADWDLARQTVPLVATDGEREFRLVLPVRHPAILRLLVDLNHRIHDHCMDDELDNGVWEPDADDWRDNIRDNELMDRGRYEHRTHPLRCTRRCRPLAVP